MIIEIEGVDGIGKTTQSNLVKSWLEERGHNAMVVKDLESTYFGREIRRMLTSDVYRTHLAEMFGFLCCKTQLFSEVIKPGLSGGSCVICDRGCGSFLSYFEACGLDYDFLSKMLVASIPSDLEAQTVLLVGDVIVAQERNAKKGICSRFDKMGPQFFEKQQLIYKRLAKERGWIVVDGNGSVEQVRNSIVASLSKLF